MAAARRLGIDLTVASERPSTFETARPADLVTLDFRDPDAAVRTALAFSQRHPVTAALGVDDDTTVAAAAINLALGRPANPRAAAQAARDKYLQRELLSAAGVPVPMFALYPTDADPAAVAAGTRFPCVVKPRRLAASRGVIRADDPAQLAAALARVARILAEPDAAACGEPARSLLVEDYVPGVEVALEGLLVDGRLHILALFDKPDPLEGPFFEETIYITPSTLPASAQTALIDVAAAGARGLGLAHGPVHAELRWNERGAWLIELAARPIGGRCSAVLRFAGGASLEEVVIRQAMGLPLPSLAREGNAAGVMMIPNPGPGVLREVRGVSEARRVPLVEDVVITAHPGERLVPLPEGARYPGFIFARGVAGEPPAAVERALRDAYRRLEFVLA